MDMNMFGEMSVFSWPFYWIIAGALNMILAGFVIRYASKKGDAGEGAEYLIIIIGLLTLFPVPGFLLVGQFLLQETQQYELARALIQFAIGNYAVIWAVAPISAVKAIENSSSGP